jgi:hypothetical protein
MAAVRELRRAVRELGFRDVAHSAMALELAAG